MNLYNHIAKSSLYIQTVIYIHPVTSPQEVWCLYSENVSYMFKESLIHIFVCLCYHQQEIILLVFARQGLSAYLNILVICWNPGHLRCFIDSKFSVQ